MKILLVLLLTVLAGSEASRFPRNPAKLSRSDYASIPQYFDQLVDHFNPEDSRTFRQKFYVNDTFWTRNPDGPIFLEINGEAPCDGIPTNNLQNLASMFGALIVTVEHRYYGESMPVSDLSYENLEYLTTRQALEDLANFIYYYKNLQNTSAPWITFGCSYAGALSAWFRIKYPHLTIGAISSSGVVNAIVDFYQFDQQVSMSAGPSCTTQLQKITKLLENLLAQSPQVNNQTKSMFLAEGFSDGDFFWLVADIAAESVQYGYQDLLCNSISGIPDNQLFNAYLNFSLNFFYPVFLGGDVYSYSTIHLQDTSASNGDRTWWWQQCSELGYFQNAPSVNSIRSPMVNMTYHQWRCGTAYGAGTWPDTVRTNIHYGGNDPQGTAIYFINSSQDPWQWAGVRHSPNWLEPADIVFCHNCGHCSELRGCPSLPGLNDMEGCANMGHVDEVRAKIVDFIETLLFQRK